MHAHIPKTAGTTLNSHLGDWFGADNVYLFWSNKMFLENLETAQKKVFIGGHAYSWNLEKHFPRATFVSMLRDPISRIGSIYNHIVDRYDHPAHKLALEKSAEDFFDYAIATNQEWLFDGQTRLFSARNNIDVALTYLKKSNWYICSQDRLEELLSVLARKFDRTWPQKVERKNVSRGKFKITDLPERLQSVIIEGNRNDMVFYERACQHPLVAD